MSRTGLRPFDIAEMFRDRCGDGSLEWVYTPMQTWVLLDAADMLDEFADTPKCETCEAMLDCDECLRADSSQKERKRLDGENAKLRELVAAMPYCMESRCLECPMCSPFDTSIGGVPECRASWKLRELGVEV